ncbi:isoprenyl transferase [Eubacteriales bacterium OttesenSCG-928-K08]|nr:isoprenyl transferase [Eubacteriales bacterium OttesenSCG-928-K08]
MKPYAQASNSGKNEPEQGMPRHVAMIMDGNGRWAKKRGLPRTLGHRAGMERMKGIIRLTSDLGIEALSLYAFSTENWKRPEEEIGALFGLLIEYFHREIDELHQNRVCIRAIGETSLFPENVRDAINSAMQKTKENTGLKLNVGLNYGAQDELLRATKAIARDVQQGKLTLEGITAQVLDDRLDTHGLPPVDFLIRTGGDRRLSNFLLYQAAYAELEFVNDYWPDFSNERYLETLRDFQSRNRRFGGL